MTILTRFSHSQLGPSRAVVPLLAMLGLLLPHLPASAQPRPARPGAGAAAQNRLALPEIQTWTLDNGLQVAFLPSDAAPVVAVEVWYHAGAKDEPNNRRGSAHMFEHMMFKGTERVRSEEHAQHIGRLGGYVNAATSEDATWYINVVPREYLDFVCQLEAERMRSLIFREDMIATEREVVKEEIRQQENSPFIKGFRRFLEVAYTRHPYSWTAGGYIEDLDATSQEDLKAFYDTYYQPNNALLVVVGAVSREEVESAAKRWFAPIPRGEEPPRPANNATEPAQTQMRRELVEPGQVGLVLGGFHIPRAADKDIYPLQVAALILGAGESSRLTERLVRADKSAVQAGATPLIREHPGILAIYAVYLDPSMAEKAEAALMDEVGKLARTGPTPAELRKAKNQLQANYAFGLENAAGLAQQIGMSWIQTGNPAAWLSDLEQLSAVTRADVIRVAKTYLKRENLTIVVVPPQGASTAP